MDIKEKPILSNKQEQDRIIKKLLEPAKQDSPEQCDVKCTFEKLPPYIAHLMDGAPIEAMMTIKGKTEKGGAFVEHVKSNMPPGTKECFEPRVGVYCTKDLEELCDRAKRFGNVTIDASSIKETG